MFSSLRCNRYQNYSYHIGVRPCHKFIKLVNISVSGSDPNVKIQDLEAADAEIGRLVAQKAGIEDLNATNADVKNLKAATGNIENLLAGNAGVGTLQAIHLTGDNIVIEDATIARTPQSHRR